MAEAGGVIETEYFETFFSEFLNDSRQLVASSLLVLENIIEQPEAKNSSFLFYCKTQNSSKLLRISICIFGTLAVFTRGKVALLCCKQ